MISKLQSQIVMCKVQVVGLWVLDGQLGGYLCSYRNLNFEGFLLVVCEPQVFGLLGGFRNLVQRGGGGVPGSGSTHHYNPKYNAIHWKLAQQWLKEVSICILSYLFEGINIHDWTASYPKLQALFRRKKDKQFVA